LKRHLPFRCRWKLAIVVRSADFEETNQKCFNVSHALGEIEVSSGRKTSILIIFYIWHSRHCKWIFRDLACSIESLSTWEAHGRETHFLKAFVICVSYAYGYLVKQCKLRVLYFYVQYFDWRSWLCKTCKFDAHAMPGYTIFQI
jgi:hypothetical protein